MDSSDLPAHSSHTDGPPESSDNKTQDEWSVNRRTPGKENPNEEEEGKDKGPDEGFGLSKEMSALLRKNEDEVNEEDPEKIIKLVVLGRFPLKFVIIFLSF